MATKKPKKYYYVLVLRDSNEPVRFVTEYETYPKKVCKWEANKKPCALHSWDDALYMSMGLAWNGTFAVPVVLNYELDKQPYKEPEMQEVTQ